MITLHFDVASSLNMANDGMAINCTAILIGPVGGDINMAVRLLPSVVGLQVNRTMATCDLGMEFRSILNNTLDLANTPSNSFLYYDSSEITESGSLLVDSSDMVYENTMGAQVNVVIPDINPPTIMSFKLLDLNEGTLVFSFSQPVNTTTFNFSDLSLQSSSVTEEITVVITLSGGQCIDGCEIGRQVTFAMEFRDIEKLKTENDVCTYISNCYPHHTDALVEDFGGNRIDAYSYCMNYLLQNLTLDTTRPHLVTCELDLSTDQLILNADEPLDVGSFNSSGIILQGLPTVTAPSVNVTLTKASTIKNSFSSAIVIDLGIDADTIKTSLGGNVTLSLSSSAFDDIAGNNIIPLSELLCNFLPDTSPPNISSFIIDLNSNLLKLTFTELVLTNHFSTSGFRITNAAGTIMFSLNDSTLLDSNNLPANDVLRIAVISFGSKSLTRIKTDSDVGTTLNNTFLLVNDNSFFDLNANGYFSSGPIAAATIIEDTSRATVIGFSLDMNIGQVVLTFNDVVKVSSWWYNSGYSSCSNEMFIQSAPLTNSRTPIRGYVRNSDSNINIVEMASGYLNSLKYQLHNGVATNINSTYLTIQADAIDDIHGVHIIAITNGNGIMANNYIRDREPPRLRYFDLYMDNGYLYIYFNEPVSSNFSLFALQGNSVNITPSSLVILSNVNTQINRCDTSCYYNLPRDIFDLLLRDLTIARNAITTNLVIMEGGVNDTSGNPMNMTGPIDVRNYYRGRSKL